MANKTDEKRRTVTVKIEGRVQGVYFRAWTYDRAVARARRHGAQYERRQR